MKPSSLLCAACLILVATPLDAQTASGGTGAPGSRAPDAAERLSLDALADDEGLAGLRASEARAAATLDTVDRDVLDIAQARDAGLAELRAGDLDDHDLKVIGVTIGVVILIALLL